MRSGWRLATLGLVFLALFVVLVFRLWFLQVAAGATYEAEAERQQVRVVATPAPRGEIRDRRGVLLAGSRASLSVVIDPRLLEEPEKEQAVVQRLAALLERATVEVRSAFEISMERNPGHRFRLAFDVNPEQALYLLEHSDEFPGVVVEPVPVRRYPEGSLAAHVLGYVGQVTDISEEFCRPGRGPVDVTGRAGLECRYNHLLQGTPGFVKYQVNARGEILSVLGEQSPVPGNNVYLTLDTRAQSVLEDALDQGIDLARSLSEPATRAAGVVIDPRDGSVVAMASWPTYDPEHFALGRAREVAEITARGAEPNWAIQGRFPPASTFKLVSYVAGLEEGIYPQQPDGTPVQAHDQTIFCGGVVRFDLEEGSQQVFTDWLPQGHGPVDLHGALEQSCDIYFWQMALRIHRQFRNTPRESIVQDWARLLGFGEPTGIDLPFEQAGLIPDRAWFEDEQAAGSPLVRSPDQGGWQGGDLMNTVIGQGAVSATVLQVANAYAAAVNGGTVWEPRLVERIVDQEGTVVVEALPREQRKVELDPATVRFLREDLGRVVSGFSGTARAAFAGFGSGLSRVGGKTGTGENPGGRADTAWFVGVAPLDDPKWVVAVVIEEGGSGGAVAAPVVRQVMQHLMGNEPAPLEPGQEGD